MNEIKNLSSYRPFLDQGDFSEIYLEESKSLSLRWEDGRIDSISKSDDSGLGFRVLIGLETRYGHMELENPFHGLEADEKNRLSRIKKALTQGIPSKTPPQLSSPRQKKHIILQPPESISLDKKVALLKTIYEVAKEGAHVRQLSVNYGEKLKNVAFLNSEGEVTFEERTYLTLSLLVTVERRGDLQTAYESMGGMVGYELFEPKKLERFARQVTRRAHLKLEAPQAPTGEMPVVIAASAGGTLIHEAVGHSLEADAVLEGTSPAYLGKMGKVVANEKLTILDDPTVPGARGSFYFDDEGTPAEKSVLIESGVLKDYMFDRLTAHRAGRKSNGHGRRESYAHKPIPRMSNTYIAPGPDDPKKILENFQNGLLVTKMGGGQVNTANGDFVFDVEEGFQVKEGKKTLVRGATLLGKGPDVLLNIDQVGTDHGWGIGTCGKEGQGVPVSDAIPTIRIKKLVIGGQ